MQALSSRQQDVTIESHCNPIKGLKEIELKDLEFCINQAAYGSNFTNDDREIKGIEELEDMEDDVACAIVNATNLKDRESLTIDESASIHLYTQESELQPVLNRQLRSANRNHLKPLMQYLKLLTTALNKLPYSNVTLYRGVKLNLSDKQLKGNIQFWWDVSSCTHDMDVLANNEFCGSKGDRTIFTIEQALAICIKKHSGMPDEEEYIMLPGTKLKILGNVNLGHGLTQIQCQQVKNMLKLDPVELPNIETGAILEKSKIIVEEHKEENPVIEESKKMYDENDVREKLCNTNINEESDQQTIVLSGNKDNRNTCTGYYLSVHNTKRDNSSNWAMVHGDSNKYSKWKFVHISGYTYYIKLVGNKDNRTSCINYYLSVHEDKRDNGSNWVMVHGDSNKCSKWDIIPLMENKYYIKLAGNKDNRNTCIGYPLSIHEDKRDNISNWAMVHNDLNKCS